MKPLHTIEALIPCTWTYEVETDGEIRYTCSHNMVVNFEDLMLCHYYYDMWDEFDQKHEELKREKQNEGKSI